MALDQHGALLKMVIVVLGSHSHFTGRPCWFWLSWFMCLSARLWGPPPSAKPAHGPLDAAWHSIRAPWPSGTPAPTPCVTEKTLSDPAGPVLMALHLWSVTFRVICPPSSLRCPLALWYM